MRTALRSVSNLTNAYSISSPQNSSSACASESARYVAMNCLTPVMRARCSHGSDSRRESVARCASFPSAHSGGGAGAPAGAAPPRRERAERCACRASRVRALTTPAKHSTTSALRRIGGLRGRRTRPEGVE
eukprot:scaffold204954_cov27-Tisochrysis_lutea.AAC.1